MASWATDARWTASRFERMGGVERTVPVLRPFKLASRDFRPQDTLVQLNGISAGGEQVIVMAGPCAVESREQLLETGACGQGGRRHRAARRRVQTALLALQLSGAGAGGAQDAGRGARGDRAAGRHRGHLAGERALGLDLCRHLQVGARNMQNYALLHAVGEAQKPVLLKRGMMSTMEELLMSAEYILSHGNDRVMLCERGIRTFEHYTRNTLDINAVPMLKQLTHLPVFVDPSHGTGKWDLVAPVAKAASLPAPTG